LDFPAEFYESIVEASPYGIILIMVFSMFVIMYKMVSNRFIKVQWKLLKQ